MIPFLQTLSLTNQPFIWIRFKKKIDLSKEKDFEIENSKQKFLFFFRFLTGICVEVNFINPIQKNQTLF